MYKNNDTYSDFMESDPHMKKVPGSLFYEDKGQFERAAYIPPPRVINDATETKASVYHNEVQEFAGKQKDRVLYVIAHSDKPLTDREISNRTGIERSTVCARRNELLKEGKIVKAGEVTGEAGVKNETWKSIVNYELRIKNGE